MKIAVRRADSGLALDMARNIYESIKDGGEVSEAVRDEMVNQAIERFTPHVAAALRRAGIDVPEGEKLSLETIRQIINAKTGLDIEELTEESIAQAVDAKMAARLSEVLGVEVSTVLDAETLKEEVKAGALEAIQSGRATKLISAAMIRAVRAAATWKRAGVPVDERRKYLQRWYAKKYRRTHRQVWG